MMFLGLLFAATAASVAAIPVDIVTKTDVDVVTVTDLVFVYPNGQFASSELLGASASAAPSSYSAPAPYSASSFQTSYASASPSYSASSAPASSTAASSAAASSVVSISSSSPAAYSSASSPAAYSPPAPSTSSAAASSVSSAAPSVVSSSSSPSSTASGDSSCSSASDQTYCQNILDSHNVHRANHSASPLTWNQELAGFAATHTATCVFADVTQDGSVSHGSNAYAGCDADNVVEAISGFYNEAPGYANYYGTSSPSCMSDNNGQITDNCGFGHFTQVVWAGTSSVGCATTSCPTMYNSDGSVMGTDYVGLTLCFYLNQGNVLGEYAANVLPPLGNPAATV